MTLAYEEAGAGDCVVLIHGHPFDRTLWQPQLAALSDEFRVLAPDLRGFGASPVTPHWVTTREYAADVAGLLDALGIARAAVAGLSMGGLVTMELAAAQQERYSAGWVFRCPWRLHRDQTHPSTSRGVPAVPAAAGAG
jgi:3-oxoadipate enol-lactonase